MAANNETAAMTEKTTRIQFLRKKWLTRIIASAAVDNSCQEDEKVIELLAEMDPTRKNEYLDWICRMYAGRQFFVEDAERVRSTLTLFDRWKHRIPSVDRDIGRHKSEQSVWDAIRKFDPTNTEEDDSITGKEQRRREKARALSESDILTCDLNGWIVASPKTHFASVWWGRGTRWCTSMTSAGHFKNYSRQGPLRIFISPEGQKFQAHMANSICCDSADRQIALDKFLEDIPQPAIKLLKEDVREFISGNSNKAMQLWHIKRFPPALLDEELTSELVSLGMRRIHTVHEQDGWKLRWVSDELSKWALGFGSDHISPDAYLLEKDGQIQAQMKLGLRTPNSELENFIVSLKSCPAEMRENSFIRLVSHWGNQMKSSAYPTVLTAAYGYENISDEGWKALANIQKKSGCDWHDYGIPEKYVTDEIAMILAGGKSLYKIPEGRITKDVIKRFISHNAPLYPTEVANRFPNVMDEDVAIAMGTWRSGEGIKYVPESFKTLTFFERIIEACPKSIEFVPRKMITPKLCTIALDKDHYCFPKLPNSMLTYENLKHAVSKNGSHLQHIPVEQRNEELCRIALSVSPDAVPFVTCEVTYEEFKRAVTVCGSMLARVPLDYRDEEMCIAALTKERGASSHVPPRVMQEISKEKERFRDAKVSQRYPADDPIHTFLPDPDVELPQSLLPLLGAVGKIGPRRTSDSVQPEATPAASM